MSFFISLTIWAMSYGLELTKKGKKGYVSAMTIKHQCQESQDTRYKDIILEGYPKATPVAFFLLHLECQTKILKACTHLASHMFTQFPSYCHFANPLDGIVLHYHCLGQVLQRRRFLLQSGRRCLRRSLCSFMRLIHFNAS